MSNDNKLKDKLIGGLFWKFGERIIAQGVSFILSLILARLLLPEQYGVISIVLVFINLANVLVTDGLGSSLIQKKDAGDVDFSTIFYCGLATSVILYAIMFVAAPFIADFYEEPILTPVIRVLSVQILLSAVRTIQHSYVAKHMLFKKFFWSTLGGTLISGIIGIIMAYNGFGVWALVQQYLTNNAVGIIVLFFTVPWRPKLKFSFASAKQLYGYSWKLLCASFISALYSDLRSMIIGKVYTKEDLAYNSKGAHFPSLIITNVNASISTVLFPAMSQVNDDREALKQLSRKSMRMTTYVIFPMMLGMFVVAEPMINVLLTEKWLPCVPFLQLSCLYWMFQPILTANAQIMKATGKSGTYLKLEIIKKIIGFALVFATMYISVYALVLSNVIFALISTIINIMPTKKLIGYGYREQIMDIIPNLLLSGIMAGVVYLVTFIGLPAFPTLVIQIALGGVFYLLASYLLKIDSFMFILKRIKKILKK